MIKSALITGDISKLNPVLYRGISLVSETPSPLQMVLMTASSTAYSYNPKTPVEEVTLNDIGETTVFSSDIAREHWRI